MTTEIQLSIIKPWLTHNYSTNWYVTIQKNLWEDTMRSAMLYQTHQTRPNHDGVSLLSTQITLGSFPKNRTFTASSPFQFTWSSMKRKSPVLSLWGNNFLRINLPFIPCFCPFLFIYMRYGQIHETLMMLKPHG